MVDKKEDILRFATAGSVDDGKSTLIGRLFFDSKSIFEDQLAEIKRISKQKGDKDVDLALLVDGLKAEREQGITIDVAYRYFSTLKRKFIIADTPGHIQYTRNMITGASFTNMILILIDAKHGILEQTKRHSFIASLLQIPHLVICINKMDLVNFKKEVFDKIKSEYELFSSKLDIKDIHFVPISALYGDNVVNKSENMGWYEGPSLLYLLENIYIGSDHNLRDCRFPVQYIIKPGVGVTSNSREYAGRIAGGIFKSGDKVRVLPSGFTTKIKSISFNDKRVSMSFPPMSVSITLEDEIDISRGDMIVRKENLPGFGNEIDLMLCWLNHNKLNLNKKYLLMHTTRAVKCLIKEILYKVDINTLHRIQENKDIEMNDIARVRLRTTLPLFYDSYKKNKTTGSIILVDESTNETVAAGMIR